MSVRWLAALLVAAALCAVASAEASERAKILYSRGLIDLNAGQDRRALELFDQAVTADEVDPYAHYYRAVARGRLGEVDGAMSDLQRALELQPDLDAAALELGVALVQKGRYTEAIPRLQQAQTDDDLAPRASLFLGVAQLRLGQRETARSNFERAATGDQELALAARYYQGVIAYQEGDWVHAQEQFDYVVQTRPSSDMGREAATFLANMRRGLGLYELYASAGFQYDTNVVLLPSNGQAAADAIASLGTISNKADGRGTISVGGSYQVWQAEHARLSLGYDFFQSLHFALHDFNIQDNGPHADFVIDRGILHFGLIGRFDYYLRKTSSFLRETGLYPWTSINEGELGELELSVRVRRREFLQHDFQIRDAFNYAPAVRQYVYLGGPDRYLWAGYRFDREEPIHDDPSSQEFAYDGQQVETGVGWALPYGITTVASYNFRYEGYGRASAVRPPPGLPLCTTSAVALGACVPRHDDDHEVIVAVRKSLTDSLNLLLAYLGAFNHSNKVDFDYDRQIASIALEARF